MPEVEVQPDDATTDESYGAIVWRQFRKKPYAMISLGVIGFLFVICVFAPFLANNRPFVLTVAGQNSYPLFEYLGRQDYLVFSAFACFWIGLASWRVFARLPRHKLRAWKLAMGIAVGTFGLSVLPISLLVVDKLDTHPSQWYRETAAMPGNSAVFPPIRFSYGEQLLDVKLMGSGDRLNVERQLVGLFETIDKDVAERLRMVEEDGAPGEERRRRIDELRREAIESKAAARKSTTIIVARANSELPSHFLGTDMSGRDVLSRMIWATRTSLAVGFVAVGIATLIGCSIGAIAGYFGGWVDMCLMRLVEIVMCFPQFFLILTIMAFWDRSLLIIMVVFGVTGWTGYTRFVRAEFLRLRKLDFAVSAKALGLGRARIMFKHLLPNALTPVLISATIAVGGAILTEAGLSFLGLGDSSAPSWGDLLKQARESSSPMLAWPSAAAILITVLAYNLMGDALRDALDPKLRS